MKKVLIALPTLFGGGAERVATVWASKLSELGYDISFLIYGRCENEYEVNKKVKIYTIAPDYQEYKKLGYFERLKRMRSIVKTLKPDVVINFLQRMQVWMMMATFGLKIRRIETIRVSPWNVHMSNKFEFALWKLCFSRADKVILQTQEQAEFFSKKVQKKSVVISNPIAKVYVDNPKEFYSEKALNFVAAGRITEQKNYPVMIEAFSKALEKYPEIKLSIYGTGDESYMSKMQALIENKGLSESIKLMGRTSDMLSVLQEADAFLMTSDYEGMPNALAEAMVVGLPCVSTNCRTGPKDMIDDGINGFLVKTGDAESISNAIVALASMDLVASQKMGSLAREKMLELCSDSNSLNKLIEVLQKR